MRWFPFNIFRSEERVVSAEFENAVNKALTADTVADATRKPYISEEGALNLSAVWACVRILSETVGTLPIHLYKRTEKGRDIVVSTLLQHFQSFKVDCFILSLT